MSIQALNLVLEHQVGRPHSHLGAPKVTPHDQPMEPGRETLGEALERVRQDIERLPERLRNEGIADYFSIYVCPPSCECEGGEE